MGRGVLEGWHVVLAGRLLPRLPGGVCYLYVVLAPAGRAGIHCCVLNVIRQSVTICHQTGSLLLRKLPGRECPDKRSVSNGEEILLDQFHYVM